jgi:hypothetical protein
LHCRAEVGFGSTTITGRPSVVQLDRVGHVLWKRSAARDADRAWGEFLPLAEGTLLLQKDNLMRPASFSPGR